MINLTLDGAQIIFGLAALATAIFPILSWLSSRKTAADIAAVKEKVEAVAVVTDQTHATTNSLSERSEMAAHDLGYAKGHADGLVSAKAEAGADALAREKVLAVPPPLPPTGSVK